MNDVKTAPTTAKITDLRVNGVTEPPVVGIRPSFSWKMLSERIGAKQEAYKLSLVSNGENVYEGETTPTLPMARCRC